MKHDKVVIALLALTVILFLIGCVRLVNIYQDTGCWTHGCRIEKLENK